MGVDRIRDAVVTVVVSGTPNVNVANVPDVTVVEDEIPRGGTTPVDSLAVADNLTHHITTSGALTVGDRYEVVVVPDVPTDYVRGVIKLGTAITTIASINDGRWITAMAPVEIVPSAGSDRVHFMRDSDTPFACTVYVNRIG